MLSMEVDGGGVVPTEEIERVDGLVLVAEEAPHPFALLVVDAAETTGGDVFVFFHDGFIDEKVLHPVFTWVLVGLCSCHAMCHHSIADFESRIDDDAIVAVEHLSVHASH